MSRPQLIAVVMPKVLQEAGIPRAKLRHLHRAGNVGLYRKNPADGEWQELGCYPADQANTYLPGVWKWLTTDAYATVNGLGESKPWPQGPTRGLLEYASRRTRNVVWLECTFADLDCYKADPPIAPSLAVAEVQRLVAEGALPQPTLHALSGRGAYVLWYLEGEPGKPVRRTRDTERLWVQVQQRIQEVLADLNPDPQAKSLSQTLRIPGSVNTKSGRRVLYLVTLEGELGGPVRLLKYRLEDLADALLLGPATVDATPLPPPAQHQLAAPTDQAKRQPYRPFNIPEKVKPHQAPYRARLLDLVKLADARGGFTEGHRKTVLHLAAWCAHQLGRSPLQAAQHFARHCLGHLPERDIRDAANVNARREYGLKDPATKQWLDRPRMERSDTLARALAVTADEARRLELQSIRPTEERKRREAEKAAAISERKKAKADHDAHLEARLVQLYAEANPSVRNAVNLLEAEGFNLKKSSVAKLKAKLGITKGSKRGRRPKTPELVT